MNLQAGVYRQSIKLRRVFANPRYVGAALLLILGFVSLWLTAADAQRKYEALLSVSIYDRNNIPLHTDENSKGHYVRELHSLPVDFTDLLVRKEDRYFYYHFGINPFSTLRSLYYHLTHKRSGGASTITQQLAKNLLGTELDRTITNKLKEAFYSLSLEAFYSKEEVLIMYANTVYLGNQVQGLETGSYAYFDKPLRDTTYSERVALLATLSYPNARNPWEKPNYDYARTIHTRLSSDQIFTAPTVTKSYSFQSDSFFELQSAGVHCSVSCHTSVDDALTHSIRGILARHIATEWERGARNGAVVVIDPKTSSVLALVGSKNPDNPSSGDQINMALEPRPIGSTVKPFIYLKGFMSGLRPYTVVDDREYKYSIATGFPLYPKNYDGRYRGEVTLHESLSNSLNVPTVKVLEYIGLQNFYAFLSDQLAFQPLRSYDSYQYGIALGGLEMDLLTLTHYFTLFPRQGTLAPLRLHTDSNENYSLPPQSDIQSPTVVSDKKFVQLVHAILSDRLSGVNQFGLTSTLNINSSDYGVKTGTSRDFHDSWVVGYTGDIVVGVWIGNTENEPLKQVTGQSGAGAVWHDVMNLLLESPYATKIPLPRDQIKQFPISNSGEWGLRDDNPEQHRTLLESTTLIQTPYNNDSFEFFEGMTIPLRAAREVAWTVNGSALGVGKDTVFRPESSNRYEIVATDPTSQQREIIQVTVLSPQ